MGRHKEVPPTPDFHKSRYLFQVPAHRSLLDREITYIGPGQLVGIVIKAAEFIVIDPGALHKLKLPADVGIQADKMQTPVFTLIIGLG